MALQANWLLKGYFQVDDQMQQIREGLAARLGRPASAVHIAFYPVGPIWKHTYWWREGETKYAEAQFFARIAEEYPVLSVGASVEKGLEDTDAVPSERREAFLMDRRTWDWQRLKSRIRDVVKTDVPACASLLARPIELRFSASQYARGRTTGMRDRWAFVFFWRCLVSAARGQGDGVRYRG